MQQVHVLQPMPFGLSMLALCRYAANVSKNPEDHDALYNWALVLQVKCFSTLSCFAFLQLIFLLNMILGFHLDMRVCYLFAAFKFEMRFRTILDFYCWFLQESADNAGSEMDSMSKDALLDEACKKYEAATQLCPTLHEVNNRT